MNDLIEMAASVRNCTVFRGLVRSDRALSKLLDTLEALGKEPADSEYAVTCYCDFAEELYRHTDCLTDHILGLITTNENVYMKKRAAGEQTGDLLDECLANELWALERLSKLPCYELLDRIDYDGFLPRYRTADTDFSAEYADCIHNISTRGFGIYSRYHVFTIKKHSLVPVEYPDPIRLSDFSGYERERGEVIDNTLALLRGKPANNVLLYGDCGTGKSSAVKAIANEYAADGLRLIELKKKQLHKLPDIVREISRNPLKFIVFIDDLSFTEDDDDYAALKAILEGSVSSTANNLCIYATSNRRHLVRETFSARQGDDVHFKDTMQETMSLSDRFGLTVVFTKPDKQLYLSVVEELAKKYDIKLPIDEVKKQAEVFALSRAGRSPRVAKQFIEYLKGCEE